MVNNRKYEQHYSKYDNEIYDSRWAETEEIKEALSEIDIAGGEYTKSGVPFLSDGGTAYADTSDRHTIVIGATGSKKTRNVAFPETFMHLTAGESAIVLDNKGENFDMTSGYALRKGYHIYVLNLRDPYRSNRWNPLAEPWRLLRKEKDIDKSHEMVNDFIHTFFFPAKYGTQDPYWDETAACLAMGLCEILLNCATMEEASIKSLVYLRNSGLDMDAKGFLVKVTSKLPRDSFAYVNLNTAISAPDRTRSCILSTFDSKLRLFSAQPGITELFSGSDFDIRQFGEEKSILYIITPDEKTTYSKLITTFIQQSYQTLIGYASKCPGRKLKVRVNYLMDEFAQLPYISDFCSAISAARSRNIRYTLYIQSLHQLTTTYGENAETILGNTGNVIFLTSRELPLLERISSLCGYSKDGTYLISPSRLQRLKNKEKGEALILVGSCYPYITTLADISQYSFKKYVPVTIPKRKSIAPLFELFAHEKEFEKFAKVKLKDEEDYDEDLYSLLDDMF